MSKIKKYALPVLALLLNLGVSLFWVALRINYSGISKFLGADTNPSFLVMNLPLMILGLVWVVAALSLVGLLLWNKKKSVSITSLVLGIVLLIGELVVIYFGAKDYLRFIMVHFLKTVAITACIGIFALVLFFPVKNSKKSLCWKAALVAVVVLMACFIGFGWKSNDFKGGAVVYAVEDDYQIVFATTDSALAWVTVGGETYYDLYAGSMRSVDTIHKITVPQKALDAAGGYEVFTQQMIYRGPFGGYKGEILSRKYDFRPVDSSDGIKHYALSDVHEAVDAAAKAAGYQYDEKLDFIVLLGDLVSMVETEDDALIANELAYKITGGEIPVIYVRGNHEIKGEYSEVLYKYVGSKNQEFYYTVTLGDNDVFAVVLDIGEDHPDDWWEYYETAQFSLYRDAQTEMMEQVLATGEHESYKYRMALCHIPIPYVDKKGYFEEDRLIWTDLINQLDVDIYLGGHKHVLWSLIPGQVEPYGELIYSEAYSGTTGKAEGGYLPDFNFPGFLAGRRSLEQAGSTQSDGKTDYVGLYTVADFAAGTQESRYINSNGKNITVNLPFAEITTDVITSPLKRPE